MSETRPFHIMAKPVSGVCNLDCRYCYYTAKPAELYPGVDRFMMSDEVLESFTRQYLAAQPVRCDFGWQGGEPMLAGLDFFRRAVELQKQYAADGQQVANAIQTNATLIDEPWAEFLADNKFLVGISLDGPPQWHDAFRKDRSGGPSFHRAWRGLELLAGRGVEFNVLVTLNSINAPHAGDIYRYFVNRGVRYLQFIPILERTPGGAPSDFSCTGEQFGRFMLEVFDTWRARDVGRVSERFIDSLIHQLIYGRPAMCCHAERCANAHVLEFNGDLYACDHFVFKEWRIGNIMDRPLAELLGDERLAQFDALKTALPDACRDCEYLPLCNGGCPKHHDPIGTSPARVNHFCQGYKMFFSEALPELRRMAPYFARNEMPPTAGTGDRALGTAAGGPGTRSARPSANRNDPCPCGSGRKFKNCCGQ